MLDDDISILHRKLNMLDFALNSVRRKVLELQDRIFELEYAVASMSKLLNRQENSIERETWGDGLCFRVFPVMACEALFFLSEKTTYEICRDSLSKVCLLDYIIRKDISHPSKGDYLVFLLKDNRSITYQVNKLQRAKAFLKSFERLLSDIALEIDGKKSKGVVFKPENWIGK